MNGKFTQEDWMTQYPVAILDRAELQHYLSPREVDTLSDADMQDIATTMQEELLELGVWEQLAFVARCKLAEKRGGKSAISNSN